jgi:hypothetical protein
MKWSEFIKNIGNIERPLVKKWSNLIVKMTEQEAEAMITYFETGNERAAYKIVLGGMRTADLRAAKRETNKRITEHTEAVLQKDDMQKEIVHEVFTAFLQMLFGFVQSQSGRVK